jgi:hypothetical protein
VGLPVDGVPPNITKHMRGLRHGRSCRGDGRTRAWMRATPVVRFGLWDKWVRVMGARRDEEWAPPVRLRRWGLS